MRKNKFTKIGHSGEKVTKMSYFTLAIVLFLSFGSCKNNSEPDANSNRTDLVLTSPKGFVLAKNQKELKELIQSKAVKKSSASNISIEKINYFESKHSSFAMVNYKNKGKSASVLLPLNADNEYLIFFDKHKLFMKKISKVNRTAGRTNRLIVKEVKTAKGETLLFTSKVKTVLPKEK
ncbi:MAG: hypothetical protein CSB06_01720 [Bacteroidia bacterium]|nr:MAG: hypothetical protein CSB06_01720 [Bacteroidia bacterium]